MEITSFVSIGQFRFGDSRQDVRQRLGQSHKSFRKGGDEIETDAYNELGLHLYYDEEDRLEFVEVFHPAAPIFEGILFMDRDLDAVADDLNAHGYATIMDVVGLSCNGAGIGLTAANGLVEGVAAFRRHYYDRWKSKDRE